MKDHVHERIGFREIDEHGNSVQAISPHVPEAIDRPGKRLSVNPFIIALWVLDAGLLWVGLWAVATAAGAMTSPIPHLTPESAQFTYMMLSNAPYALLAAVLIMAGLLFWHAARWQRKRMAGEQSPPART
ncbi:hypothetical protein [Paenarthrobacter nitroguajacolicus]|uniref:hypothetical protein n=1 Tax=Paenarthrobacter nitroguajacolicus TaxID=211146 RepID=UPI00248C0F2E|nr:hypothetical protein [Paenarthrobacter nitroguajacolicus]MDI2035991.1 hypothetical protein [Paenarthrobacter nitroguajacolicus]